MAAATMRSPTAQAKARVNTRGIVFSSLEADHSVVVGFMPECRSHCHYKIKRKKAAVKN
jgi:hypothetical protein